MYLVTNLKNQPVSVLLDNGDIRRLAPLGSDEISNEDSKLPHVQRLHKRGFISLHKLESSSGGGSDDDAPKKKSSKKS